MTTVDNRRLVPFKIGAGAVRELKIAYESPWSAYRELVSNGIDQYVCSCKDGKHVEDGTFYCAAGKQHIIEIFLDRKNNEITVVDHATGIQNVKRFEQLFTDSPDGSDGKRLGDILSSYKKSDGRLIGRKNIGRQGAGILSKNGEVQFRSNNGKNGHVFTMVVEDSNAISWITDSTSGDVYDLVDTTAALPFRGVSAKITDVRYQYQDMKLLAEKLGEWFALHLVRNSKETNQRLAVITIKDIVSGKILKVTKPDYILTDDEITNDTHFKLPTSKEFVSYRIQHGSKKEGNHEIDVRVNKVKICSFSVPYWVKKGSYINNEGILTNCVNQGRERVYDSDPCYQEIFNEESGVLAKFFKRENYEEVGEQEEKQGFKARRRFEEYLSIGMDTYARLYPDAKPLAGNQSIKGSTGEPNKKQGEEAKSPDKPIIIEGVDIVKTDEPTGITKMIDGGGGSTGGGPGGGTPINYEIIGEGPYNVKQQNTKPKPEEKKVKSTIIVDSGKKGKTQKTFYMDAPNHAWVNTDRPAAVILLGVTNSSRQDSLIIGYIARAIVTYNVENNNVSCELADERYENLFNTIFLGRHDSTQ